MKFDDGNFILTFYYQEECLTIFEDSIEEYSVSKCHPLVLRYLSMKNKKSVNKIRRPPLWQFPEIKGEAT